MENNLNSIFHNKVIQKQVKPSFKSTEALQLPTNQYLQADTFTPSEPDYSQVELPTIYQNTSKIEKPPTFVEKLKKVDLFGGIYPWFENPLLMGGTCLALAKGLDKYTEGCGGEYEKSVLGKVTKFGDNLENSKFVQSKPIQTVLGWINTGATKVNNLLKKSDLITAMRKTPARPEKQMPKSELISQEVRFLHDFNDITRTLKLIPDEESAGMLSKVKGGNSIDFAPLKNLGLDKSEKKFLEEIFGKNYKKTAEEKLSNAIQLKRLNYSNSEINKIINSSNATEQVKKAILDTLGLTIDDIKNARIEPEKYIAKIKEAVTKAGKKVRIGDGHHSWLGDFQILERTISCDQIANKLKSINEGAKTKTGKFFAKAVHKIHRGFTFGGGKLGMWFFIAPSIVMMLKNLKKADKDQKVGTFAYGSIESISWVFTFPLAIAATYALGGMRFAGMSKESVKKFMEKTDVFNKLVDSGKLTDKAMYDKALKALKADRKALRHVEKQNLFARMVKGVTNFFYSDLNTIRSYKSGNFLADKARQIPNFFRHLCLEPIRFVLCAFGFESLFRNLIEKGSKTVFGNHYDHMKEEEHEALKKEQKKFTKEDLEKRLYEAQYEKLNPTTSLNQAQTYSPELPEATIANIKEDLIANAEEKERLAQEKRTKMAETVSTVENNTPETTEETTTPIETVQEEAITKSSTEEITKPAEINNEITTIPKTTTTAAKTENAIPNSVVLKPETNQKIDNYTYIPSSENIFAKQTKEEEPVKKYIPSQIGAKFTKTFDNSGIAKAMRRADLAEQKAVQILAGNFNGI